MKQPIAHIIFRSLLYLGLSHTLLACGGAVITNVEPAQTETHFINVGDEIRFSVLGPEPVDGPDGNDVVYTWMVNKFGDDDTIREVVARDVLEYVYPVQTGDERYSMIRVSLSVDVGTQVGDVGVSTVRHTITWELKAGVSRQVPPVWEGSFFLHNNNDIASLAGFTSITGGLKVSQTSMKTLDALSDIQEVSGDVSITSNNSLQSLSGLSVAHIGGGLRIAGNYSLPSLFGLEQIVSIEGLLAVNANPKLLSIGGTENLEYVGALYIYDNNQLNAFDGFTRLQQVGGDITIRNNDALCGGDTDWLIDQLSAGGGVQGEVDVSLNNPCH